MSLNDRLDALGISEEELGNLLFLFGPEYSRYQMMKYDEKLDTVDPGGRRPGWGGLTLEKLADHFLHRRYVLGSTRVVDEWASWEEDGEGRQYTDFSSRHTCQVTLDLDVHSVEQLRTLRERYWTLRSLFKPTPLVFQSSASRGLHLAWLLADLVPVHEVVQRTKRALASKGRGLRKGDGVEIFPTTNANLLRLPLGAGGAFLDPETLLPVDLPFPEIYRMVMKAWESASELEDLFHLPAAQTPPEDDEADDRSPLTEADKRSAPPKRDKALEKKLWEEGLSAEHTLQEAQFRIIHHVFYTMHIQDEEALSEAVIGWVREKNNGRSHGYNEDPEGKEEEILGLVQGHLDWVAEDPVRRGGGPDRSLRLTEGDYRVIVEMAPKVQASGHLLNVKQSHVQEGIAALLLYVKQRCGPYAKSPTVPIPAKDMRGLQRWGKDRGRPNDYSHWLNALQDAGILVSANANFRAGGGTGECRTYTLCYDFCDGDPVENYQVGFDAVLGPGKVKTLRRGTKPSSPGPPPRRRRPAKSRRPRLGRLEALKGPKHKTPPPRSSGEDEGQP